MIIFLVAINSMAYLLLLFLSPSFFFFSSRFLFPARSLNVPCKSLFPKSHLESKLPLSVLFVKFPLTIYISIFLLLLPLHCHHCFLPLIAVCTLSSLVLPFWRPNRTEGPIVPLFTISGRPPPRLQYNPATTSSMGRTERRWRKEKKRRGEQES